MSTIPDIQHAEIVAHPDGEDAVLPDDPARGVDNQYGMPVRSLRTVLADIEAMIGERKDEAA